MTEEQIATAQAILSEENLMKLGFVNIGKTADRYYGEGYQYKCFGNIRILDFMGIRTLELQFGVCDFVNRQTLKEYGVTDVHHQYKIYDTVNESPRIEIHSNEELVSICERWAKAIKAAGLRKAKETEEYYAELVI